MELEPVEIYWDKPLGMGSYGKVYKGCIRNKSHDSNIDISVQVVPDYFFKQNQEIINILYKLKRNCEYFVDVYPLEIETHVYMTMKLYECDLDYLLLTKQFQEQEITLFLRQLGEAMKALNTENLFHGNLKPGNILYSMTGNFVIKLNNIGFACHCTNEPPSSAMFQAPEMLAGSKLYDAKVDLWSIGALLYKVIVGQCGFYAQPNDIYNLLNKKGDAIAWEHSTTPNYEPIPKVKYIKELPPEIDNRLSVPYKQKMNQLLVSLLKLDPLERMTFSEFFDFVDDLVKSKVEVINLLHGSSFKFMMEPGMKLDHLLGDIQVATGVLAEHQIIFSAQSDIYLSYNSGISEADFNIFMNSSGGSHGQAVLCCVPINEVMATQCTIPGHEAVNTLNYCVKDRADCVNLITERKYSDEIVHALSRLQKQMERQFSCIQEFRSFCTKQLEILYTKLRDTRQLAQQTIARVTLANECLSVDVAVLDKRSSLVVKAVEEYIHKVEEVRKQKEEIEKLVSELELHLQSCDDAIMQAPSLEIDDIVKKAQELTKFARVLPEQRKDFIYQKCEELLGLCKGFIVSSSERAHKMLNQLYTPLSGGWSVLERVKTKKEELDNILFTSVPKLCSNLLATVSTQTAILLNEVKSERSVQREQKDIEINKLKKEVERITHLKNKAEHELQIANRKLERVNQTNADRSDTSKCQKLLKSFFNDDYLTLLEDLCQSQDWMETDVDDLLVGMTELSYESAKDVVLEGVHSELQEIFNYDPSIKRCREDDSHPMRLQGITRAFEILLCHYKDEDNPEKIQQTLMKKLQGEDQEHLNELCKKVNSSSYKDEFEVFKTSLNTLMISMVKHSPPMLLHKPLAFEEMLGVGLESMLQKIPKTRTEPPLHYRRPVILTSYVGNVCVTGYAGSKECFENTHEYKYYSYCGEVCVVGLAGSKHIFQKTHEQRYYSHCGEVCITGLTRSKQSFEKTHKQRRKQSSGMQTY